MNAIGNLKIKHPATCGCSKCRGKNSLIAQIEELKKENERLKLKNEEMAHELNYLYEKEAGESM